MTTAFIFPGQGSQSVGMGKALADASPAARAMFEQVDEALKQNLTRLMFKGPEDQLTLTANAQPAIMASSLAALAVLEAEGGIRLAEKAAFVAGHSLGEYSALAAAGAIPADVTAKLLRPCWVEGEVLAGGGLGGCWRGFDRLSLSGWGMNWLRRAQSERGWGCHWLVPQL